MNKTKIFTLLFALAPALVSAQNDIHAIQYQTQYGDAMGYTDNETATKTTEFLYGKNNRLERKIQSGRNEDGSWNLINYYRFDYDSNDNVVMTNSLQYGMYDQNNFSFKAVKDTVDYEYNNAGQLIKETERATKTTHEYEYDAEGRLVKDSRIRYYQYEGTYKTDLVITYGDFTIGGPQSLVAEATSSYNNYTGKITYDANGNKTSEKHWTVADTPVLKSAEYWSYDANGKLALYEKKGISSGEEINATKVEYEQVDENTTCAISYTYSTDHWSMKPGSKTITKYSDFNASQYAPEITSIVADASKSQVVIAFTSAVANATYNIYCDGILVGSTSGNTYTDENVKNGQHEYFVQTVSEGKNYNVSNVATVDVVREYPCATNFRAKSATLTTDGLYEVTLTWNNPVITEDMNFVNTNIIKVGKYYSTPMFDTGYEITDPTQNSCVVSFGIDTELTLYVQTRYAGGVVSSDTITVDVTKILGKVVNNNRKLRVDEVYGDAMDTTDGMSKKTVNYYGVDNRIERKGHYNVDYGTKELGIYEYESYIYDEAGMLEKSYTNQYGRYDYGDMGFKAAQDTTYYENNLEGQVTKEYNKMGYTTYEYDNAGSLIKKHIVEYSSNNDIEQTLEYSNFAGKNLPQLTVSTGTRSSARYKIETEYNEDGKVLTAEKTMDAPSSSYPSTFEKCEYNEDGELTVDSVFSIKYVNDIKTFVNKSYTTYEPEDINYTRVVVKKYVWDTILKKFSNPKTFNIYEYTDIDADKYAPTLSVEPVAEKMNAATLTVEVPYALQNAMTALNVYRNGIEIAHGINYMDDDHYVTDEYGTNGKWVYEDQTVNGTYDYYVEYAHLDNTMSQEESVHNISNVVRYTYALELPVVTGLEVTGARYTITENETDDGIVQETQAYASLKWDAPKDADVYGIKQYRVMETSMSIGENDDVKDPLATTYELDLRGRETVNIYIQAVYEYGRSASEILTITEEELKQIADRIESVNGKINTDGKTYNLAGQQVDKNYKGIVISNGKKTLVK